MPTRRFSLIKFSYQRDDGSELVRVQRVAEDITGITISPVTPAFLARQVLSPTRLLATNLLELRSAVATIDGTDYEQAIAARAPDARHVQQLKEIAALDRVQCVAYRGESRRYA